MDKITNEEIIKGNRIIAVFMGWREDRIDIHERRLQYHSSYDWLMPVVDRINEIYNQSDDFLLTKIHETPNAFAIIEMRLCGPTIMQVWSCVLDFIQWYQSLTPSTKEKEVGK